MNHSLPMTNWAPNMHVVARYDFMPTSGKDLPFSKNEKLVIIGSTDNPDWLYARNERGEEGRIPISYVYQQYNSIPRKKNDFSNVNCTKPKWNKYQWFHGKISRDEAEKLLNPREDGLYLVRESTNYHGDYTLCVCYKSEVQHYRIRCVNDTYTIDEDEYFNNPKELIRHYEEDSDGLCTKLRKIVPKTTMPGYTSDPEEAKQVFKANGWCIDRSMLQLNEKDTIGKGEFGDVLLGELKGEKVAVKKLKDNSQAAKVLCTEASVMTNLKHPNLVALLGLVFDMDNLLLVTEYMSKGSLVDYLRSRGRLHVTKHNQINFACDTAKGMEYLESQNVVHKDLAARNVLIGENGEAKVCDFGLAHEIHHTIDEKFPIKWTAPEALRRCKFSNKSDMWSFGVLLWEIYSFGRIPYPRIPVADVMKHIEKGHRMESPDDCPAQVYALMQNAWNIEPDKRPTFQNAVSRLSDLLTSTPRITCNPETGTDTLHHTYTNTNNLNISSDAWQVNNQKVS